MRVFVRKYWVEPTELQWNGRFNHIYGEIICGTQWKTCGVVVGSSWVKSCRKQKEKGSSRKEVNRRSDWQRQAMGDLTTEKPWKGRAGLFCPEEKRPVRSMFRSIPSRSLCTLVVRDDVDRKSNPPIQLNRTNRLCPVSVPSSTWGSGKIGGEKSFRIFHAHVAMPSWRWKTLSVVSCRAIWTNVSEQPAPSGLLILNLHWRYMVYLLHPQNSLYGITIWAPV